MKLLKTSRGTEYRITNILLLEAIKKQHNFCLRLGIRDITKKDEDEDLFEKVNREKTKT